MTDSDLVMELIEMLKEIKHNKLWCPKQALPVRRRALMLLMFLHHHSVPENPGLQPSELGKLLKMTRPTVTTLVNSLEEHNLVERINDDEDRRVVFVRPTEQGIDLVLRTRQEFAGKIEAIIDYLGHEDGKELIRIIKKVHQFLKDQEDDPERGEIPCGN